MGSNTPFDLIVAAQDGASSGALQAGEETPPREPLLDGADTALWVGVIAFCLIFVLVLLVIIRGRVIKPAERKARESNFFEPAGADAEIVFDDPAEEDLNEKKSRKDKRKERRKKRDRKNEARKTKEHDPSDLGDLSLEPATIEQEEAQPEKKPRPPFAGLFKRRDKDEDETPPVEAAEAPLDEPQEDFAEVVIKRTEEEDRAREPRDKHPIEALKNRDQDFWHTGADRDAAELVEARQREELERAEEERRRAIEEAAQARAEADENRRRAFAQENAARESDFERRKAEAALEQRMESLAAMQRNLTEKTETLSSDALALHHRIGAALDQKFAALTNDLNEKLSSPAPARLGAFAQATDEDADRVSADSLMKEIEAMREATEKSLTDLGERIDTLSAAHTAGANEDIKELNRLLAERAAPAVAGAIQLHDLVRSGLPAERFQFDYKLQTGGVADCLITASSGQAPFAIDARFPADAFAQYAERKENETDQAKTQYRRAILRHMIFIKEKLVSPDETSDFAVMFVPNDTIFNDLHRNFADIVQDSYRARVWIVSPTSLMATLHMMTGAAALARTEKETSDRMNGERQMEIDALNARIERLETDLARALSAPQLPLSGAHETTTAQIGEAAYRDEDLADYVSEAAATRDQPAEQSAASEPPTTVEKAAQYGDAEVVTEEKSAAADEVPRPAEDGGKEIVRPPFPLR